MKKLATLFLLYTLLGTNLLYAQGNDKIYAIVKQMPQLMEGSLQRYIYQHTTYPAKAKEQKLEGAVVIGFVVEPSGQVGKVKLMKPVHAILDEEALKIVRALPRFTPGYHEGKPVRVQMYIPVRFSLKPLPEPEEEQPPIGTEEMVVAEADMLQAELAGDPNGIDPDMVEAPLVEEVTDQKREPDLLIAEPQAPQQDDILTFAEQMPEFNGDLYTYLSKNINYPASARELGISGKVIAAFVVEKDGSISNIEVLRKAGNDFDTEAIRVIKSMPAWKPGKQNGKPVRVRFTLPITFALK
jgi:TonB family protein